jgi:hypothetical protein
MDLGSHWATTTVGHKQGRKGGRVVLGRGGLESSNIMTGGIGGVVDCRVGAGAVLLDSYPLF